MADIRHSIQIAANPTAVYPLVTTATGFARWWAADVTEPDGNIELAFFNRSTVYQLSLTACEPPLFAEWLCETGKEWIGTQLVFHLNTLGSGTVLNFSHSGWFSESDYFVSCNTTWGELMFRLKSAAEGNHRGPLFLVNGLASEPGTVERSG
jgi:uncharacterized protein YndB with AHSA1/START domain